MAITYSLAPNPKWYIADLVGRPLAGGYLATFSNLDNTALKPVFQDIGGQFPWPYVTIPNVGKLGILFDENGAQGPFYFESDSDNPQDTYYLEVYDSDGVLQWTISDFTPSGGGGGSVVTVALDLENLVTNSVMWRNLGASSNPISTTFLNLCPGAHAGLAATSSNAGPDINFIKNNTNASDQIQFIKFPLGSTPLTGDVTPVDYLNYACGNAPSGETSKLVQYPITHSVQNLSNQNVTVTIWAKVNSGSDQLLIQWRQFFGNGAGASPDVLTPIQTLTLSNSWQKFSMQTTVPSVSGKVLGDCGNDALFLQVQYPLGAACDIDFTKISLYLGNIAPTENYSTYDMIDSLINSPRTSDVTFGFASSTIFGYVEMNDRSIGSASSGATNRANIDTFPLYNLLWNNVSDTWAPVSGGRGANAIADFTANKNLTLTRVLGRVIGSAGAGSGLTARVLGEFLGEETHTLTVPEIPAHTHDIPQSSISGAAGTPLSGTGTNPTIQTGSTGGGGAHNNMQPSSFMNLFIKL